MFKYLKLPGIDFYLPIKSNHFLIVLDFIRDNILYRDFPRLLKILIRRPWLIKQDKSLIKKNFLGLILLIPFNILAIICRRKKFEIDADLIIKTRHSIKFFDFQNKKITTRSITFDSQSLRLLTKDLAAKNKFHPSNLAPIIYSQKKQESSLIFEEELVVQPYYLFNNGEIIWSKIDSLFDHLSIFYKSSLKQTLSEDLINSLMKKILSLPNYEQQIVKQKMSSLPKKYLVAEVHGDLVPANILVKKNNPCLIDWTYSGQYSLYFDFFTLMNNLIKSKTNNLNYFDERTIISFRKLHSVISKVQLQHLVDDNFHLYKKIYFLERLNLWLSLSKIKSARLLCRDLLENT